MKPVCRLTGTDGNVFSVIANVSRALKGANLPDEAEEFKNKALACQSYEAVLTLCHDYVDVR